MALQIPAIVSPVGVNNTIVEHKKNGFLCDTPESWKATLISLLESTELRKTIGLAGQETVRNRYSVEATTPHYIQLLS